MHVINVCTPSSLDPADSFGILAIELARHLTRLGVYVNLFAMGHRNLPTQDAEIAAIIAQPVRAATGMIGLGYPTTYAAHGGLTQVGPKVGIAMFESTKIPAGWTEAMSSCAAIVTPCNFCRDIFLDDGVTRPITVAPLGINPRYVPAERDPDRPFTFLAFADRGMRKGGIQALDAFVAGFGEDMNYKLIIKRRKSKINAQILNPNVELIQEDYTEAQMHELYLRADCLINANKGEGFGLIPREFAATGGIALATNFAGTADDIERWGIPLDYKLVKADWGNHGRLSGQDLGDWAEVDFQGLVDTMEAVADNKDFYRRRAKRQAPGVQALYSWEKFAATVLNIWEEATDGNTHPAGQLAAVA